MPGSKRANGTALLSDCKVFCACVLLMGLEREAGKALAEIVDVHHPVACRTSGLGRPAHNACQPSKTCFGLSLRKVQDDRSHIPQKHFAPSSKPFQMARAQGKSLVVDSTDIDPAALPLRPAPCRSSRDIRPHAGRKIVVGQYHEQISHHPHAVERSEIALNSLERIRTPERVVANPVPPHW